MNLDLAKQGSW